MAFLLLSGCTRGSKNAGITSIPQLQQQVSLDSLALHELKVRYQDPLQADFLWCDSMLAFVNEQEVEGYFNTLNLAQAYLNQFNAMLPTMNHDIAYLQEQLTNLQNDLDTHYLNDSLASLYFEDEKAVADTLHHRILYFEDKLAQQSMALQTLKKNLCKATAP